jgi:CubicO group peptidase (beta-lactamase class C family)
MKQQNVHNLPALRWRPIHVALILIMLLAACSTALPTIPESALPSTTAKPENNQPTSSPAILPSDSPSFTVTPNIFWPTQGWHSSTPEEQGMDSSRLASMMEWIHQARLNLHSLLIIRHGTIVSETYFGSYHQNDLHQLYSCTKSFIATLFGIALDRGDIQSISRSVMDFFPGRTFANMDSQKQAMTLEDLLTMRSGLDWLEGDSTLREMVMSPDWAKYVLDKPMVQAPGSLFNYCSGCSHVLSTVLQQATDMNLHEYAARNLFEPLGITHVQWESDPSGIPNGGWGMHLTPRDMAKLGYLYLHNGVWDGHQVVSTIWVQTATQKHTKTDGTLDYGYLWWVLPSLNSYAALGLEGQTIFVDPKADLIVVTTAATDGHDQIFQLIEEYVLPSITFE